jgi:hypothetical protein
LVIFLGLEIAVNFTIQIEADAKTARVRVVTMQASEPPMHCEMRPADRLVIRVGGAIMLLIEMPADFIARPEGKPTAATPDPKPRARRPNPTRRSAAPRPTHPPKVVR